MIEDVVARWHAFLKGELPGGLDDLLHDDCVFYSPIVFSPQRGKALTAMYLTAAGATFGGEKSADAPTGEPSASDEPSVDRSFRYTKKVLAGNHAVLEFETFMGDVAVNGVDIITCDDDGRIVEFKVMIRPLKAVNEVHARMRAMLERMGPPATA